MMVRPRVVRIASIRTSNGYNHAAAVLPTQEDNDLGSPHCLDKCLAVEPHLLDKCLILRPLQFWGQIFGAWAASLFEHMLGPEATAFLGQVLGNNSLALFQIKRTRSLFAAILEVIFSGGFTPA